ncbi:MAG: Mov34/MPN/PAD-1 family protein [Candidatus Lokiarchaeota archaeon]|nr:Mov34/MPN/PAD-1 family protein [Candidatus Lokiarchaeota archaeon]
MRFEKDIVFYISNNIVEKINNCIKLASPNEANGFILGYIQEVNNNNGDFNYNYYSVSFHCIESNKGSTVSFLLDDDRKILELSDHLMKNENLKLIAILHSHPTGTTPSSTDKHSMKYYHNSGLKKFTHLIWIIVDSRKKEMNGFIYLRNKLTQIKLILSTYENLS